MLHFKHNHRIGIEFIYLFLTPVYSWFVVKLRPKFRLSYEASSKMSLNSEE